MGLSGQSVQIGFLRPGTIGEWEFTNKGLRAGNRYNVSIATQRTSLDELGRLNTILKDSTLASGFSENDSTPMTDEMIDESLRLSGMFYFGMVDELSDYASKISDVVSVNHISMGYIVSELKPVGFFGMIWGIDEGGMHIDVVRSVHCPTSTTGNSDDEVLWMNSHGAIATNMEHAMIELLYEVEAVSTGKIFHETAKQGIPIHVLDDLETLEADLAAISAHSVVKNHIRAYVNAGYTAAIPQRGVTIGDWSGQGWTVMDEATGAAGYMICGGLHGDNTIIHGSSSSMPIGLLIAKLFTLMYKIADLIIVPCSIAFVAALKAFAIYFAIGSPFGFIILLWYPILACVMMCIALIIFMRLYENIQGMYIPRRMREYVYA